MFLHFASDAQKYFSLKLKKDLIKEGFFKNIRNTNYLGEILIYLSFAILSMSFIPLVILALMDSPKLNVHQMGTAYRIWFASAEIGGVLGPVSAGRIADSAFGYDGVLWLMVAVCLMMILLAYALRMRADESN